MCDVLSEAAAEEEKAIGWMFPCSASAFAFAYLLTAYVFVFGPNYAFPIPPVGVRSKRGLRLPVEAPGAARIVRA